MSIPLSSPRFTSVATRARFQQALENSPTIKRKESHREAVRIIQQALIDLGFPLPKSTKRYDSPDGDFGNETDDAVRKFQGREFPGQTPDGKIGKNTLSRMDDLLPHAGAPLPPLVNLEDADMDELATQAVLSVLKGPNVTRIHFKYRSQTINWGWYWKVKQLVEEEKIRVLYDPLVGDYGLGVYNPDESTMGGNSIVLPNVSVTTWKSRSVILHECTHAVQDVQAQALDRLESEGAAYIAQNIYHRLTTNSKLRDSSPLAQAIHDAADPLAQLAIRDWYPEFATSQLDQLETAIRNAGYVSGSVRFNGV